MKYYLTVLILLPFLASCSPGLINTNVCPPVKQYSRTEQLQVKKELEQCQCPVTVELIKDYKVSRDQSRACGEIK